MQQFIASHAKSPKELVLDLDATHLPLHGQQERGYFHAEYDNDCYLPLYVFARQDMPARVLRPSGQDPASVGERADGRDALVVMSPLDREYAARVALGPQQGP